MRISAASRYVFMLLESISIGGFQLQITTGDGSLVVAIFDDVTAEIFLMSGPMQIESSVHRRALIGDAALSLELSCCDSLWHGDCL